LRLDADETGTGCRMRPLARTGPDGTTGILTDEESAAKKAELLARF